jgi:ERCC4-type nuclease
VIPTSTRRRIELTAIPGITRLRAEALLEAFGGSLRSLMNASTSALANVSMSSAKKRARLGREAGGGGAARPWMSACGEPWGSW